MNYHYVVLKIWRFWVLSLKFRRCSLLKIKKNEAGIELVFPILLCLALTGCSKIRQNTLVVDGLVENNKLYLLLHSDEYRVGRLISNDYGPETELNHAYGMGVVDLKGIDTKELKFLGSRDMNGPSPRDNYFGSRLCAGNAYLVRDHIDQVERYSFTNVVPEPSSITLNTPDGRFFSSKFCLSPNGQNIVNCGSTPTVIDSKSLQPVVSVYSKNCADFLCENWTSVRELDQVVAVSDNLEAIAIQTMLNNPKGYNQFSIWNFRNGFQPKAIVFPGSDIVNLVAIQMIGSNVWSLFYTIPDVGSTKKRQMYLANENGEIQAQTEALDKTFVNSNFSCVVSLRTTMTNLCIKVWHPFEKKDEMLYVKIDKISNEIYKVWKK